MINIALCCQNGASTSLISSAMERAAKEKKLDVRIQAYAFTELGGVIDSIDMLLLGPQVRYMFNDIKKKYPGFTKPVAVIDSLDFGMMNGDAILTKALAQLHK